jgi:hypothetical protein
VSIESQDQDRSQTLIEVEDAGQDVYACTRYGTVTQQTENRCHLYDNIGLFVGGEYQPLEVGVVDGMHRVRVDTRSDRGGVFASWSVRMTNEYCRTPSSTSGLPLSANHIRVFAHDRDGGIW